MKGRYKKDPATHKRRIKLSTHRARIRVMMKLGGLVCVGCDENDYRVLTIDHVDGHTSEDPRNNTSGYLYKILRGEVPTKGLRVLCANCQSRNEHRRGNRVVYPEIIDELIAAGARVDSPEIDVRIGAKKRLP